MDGDRLHRLRLRAQLLTGAPARTAEDVVGRLLAVQGQDGRGARLAIRSRSRGVTAADVDAALTERRTLLITWLNRGTLHLVTADDYWWLHPLTTPQLKVASERRLRQEGVSPRQAARGIDVVAAAVEQGPTTRAQLRAALERAKVPTAAQAFIHVVFAASLQRLVVRGPMVGADHAYVSPAAWLGGSPRARDRDEALARLAHRYLAGHGPATADDLSRWAGITLGDARTGIDAIRDDVIRVEPVGGGDLLHLARGSTRTAPPVPGPRLLGAFEPVLLGWVSRDAVIGPHRNLVTDNGVFRPFAMAGGRAVATWGLAGGVVSITALERLHDDVGPALASDAGAVLDFLGLPKRRVAFT